MNDDQPDPEEILKAIQKEEQQNKLGRLKIFFGMSAGVGKTYAMLEQAQHRILEGVNVLVGTVNTHGRKETEALLKDLPILPEKWVKYKDTVFEELDLEKILELKPDLVLIDELAHTNVPGSKHAKRWQDVMDILDAGIDVYTTLNVQHIESRKDIVEGVTGIQIRETVPDIILERAATIELIDLPPQDLLDRLKEGKVYLGEQSQVAALNFFKEDSLTALREIALRLTAEKVEHDLHGMLSGGRGWKTREKLMVAVSSSPSSQYLIREARRLAFELDAPWLAVHVDTGVSLSDEDQARLVNHLNLARDLGAEVITTHDLDVSNALQRIANQKSITRIVIGRTPSSRKGIFSFFRESFVDRLERENKHVDIVILRTDKVTDVYHKFLPRFTPKNTWNSYLIVCLAVIFLSILGLFIFPLVGYKSVGFIFLLGILVLTFFVGQAPIFLAAILSTISWNVLFMPPFLNPVISDYEDIVLVIIYFVTASTMGLLTTRIRKQDQFLHIREEKMERLYEIERDIANAANVEYLRLNVITRLKAIFPGEFDILVKTVDNKLNFESSLPILNDEKEKAVAMWVFQHGKLGGWSTNTLPSAEAMYFPIKFSNHTNGILVYHPKGKRPLSLDQIDFLQTVTGQIGIYLERSLFEEKVKYQDYTIQTEKLHNAIFHSLNRSFYIPLEQVMEIYRQMQTAKMDPNTFSLIEKMKNLILNVKFTADNIITISEIESGFMHFQRKMYFIKDLIDQCLVEIKPFQGDHSIEVLISSEKVCLPFDFYLMKQVVNNLLINALEHSPPAKKIQITVDVFEKEFELAVIDEGPGIPKDVLPQVFEKFYRLPGSPSAGMGLGLAIVRSIVDMHQGHIEVKSQEKGTHISIILPATIEV